MAERRDAPDPHAPELEALFAFARRAAAALPGRIARITVLGARPAPDADFPVGVVFRGAVTSPDERRALRRPIEQAALPATKEGVPVQVYLLEAEWPDANLGTTLWPLANGRTDPA